MEFGQKTFKIFLLLITFSAGDRGTCSMIYSINVVFKLLEWRFFSDDAAVILYYRILLEQSDSLEML